MENWCRYITLIYETIGWSFLMKHRGTVKIETDRLILRRFDKKDLEQIYYNCWCEFDVWK